MNKPKINETKVTEAAVLLITLEGGNLEYMKLVKLLYNIDREALKRWGRPITFDVMFSLPQGQILSGVLDMAKKRWSETWNKHIANTDRYHLMVTNPLEDYLSAAEVALIKEIQKQYVGWDGQDMGKEHKDASKFPEYSDPDGGRIETRYEVLLRHLGFSEEDISDIAQEFEELVLLEELKA